MFKKTKQEITNINNLLNYVQHSKEIDSKKISGHTNPLEHHQSRYVWQVFRQSSIWNFSGSCSSGSCGGEDVQIAEICIANTGGGIGVRFIRVNMVTIAHGGIPCQGAVHFASSSSVDVT